MNADMTQAQLSAYAYRLFCRLPRERQAHYLRELVRLGLGVLPGGPVASATAAPALRVLRGGQNGR